MTAQVAVKREEVIAAILAKQDQAHRWGYDPRLARERPEYLYYSPNYKSTLWTLVALADLQAPRTLAQARPALELLDGQFYDPAHGIFCLPGMAYFPIPCLSGNMLYLHAYFQPTAGPDLSRTIDFFAAHQRFDDGGHKTPTAYPYCGNRSCYGGHSCYWGVVKLMKGLSFIPPEQRSPSARALLERCIDFVLLHEVCFSSRRKERLLHRDVALLTFPNFYKSELLEILWILAREGVRDARVGRAVALLKASQTADGTWAAVKDVNTIVSTGRKGQANVFITERAQAVLRFYDQD